MDAETYVKNIVAKYALTAGRPPAATAAAQEVYKIIQAWAVQYLLEVTYSGSSAKGTAISGISDVDLFISLSPETPGTLADIYNNLANYNGLKAFPPSVQEAQAAARFQRGKPPRNLCHLSGPHVSPTFGRPCSAVRL